MKTSPSAFTTLFVRPTCSLLLAGLIASHAYGQESQGTPPSSPPQPAAQKPAEAPPAKPTPAPAKIDPSQLSPDAATVEMMMNQAVKNIATRYNLNKEQTEVTTKIMKRYVEKVLKENEEDIWPAIREMLKVQLTRPDDVEEAKKLGRRVQPLLGKIKDAIRQGNDEWRMYLDVDQKRMHDYDLREMEKSFEQVDRNFEAWAKGEPSNKSPFPPPPPPQESPPRPKAPPEGLPKPEVQSLADLDPRFVFDVYVEEFIKKYQLDQGQIDSARSILQEFNSKANDYYGSKKQELQQIATELRQAHEGGDREKLTSAEAARKKLLEPVNELFSQMDERLRSLLTTAQIERQAAAEARARTAPKSTVQAKPDTAKSPAPGENSKPSGAADGPAGTKVPVKKQQTSKKPATPEPAAKDEGQKDKAEEKPPTSQDR